MGKGNRRNSAGLFAPVPAETLSSPWQRERCQLLHRLCLAIERKRERGRTLRQALRWPGWYWKNRTYRCDPTRKIQISRGTLKNCYYIWRRGGKTAASLSLRYGTSAIPIPQNDVLRFVRSCLAPGACSLEAVYRAMAAPSHTLRTFRDSMPRALLQRIRRLHRARITNAEVERHAAKLLERMGEPAT
jgi:hypothetical protein